MSSNKLTKLLNTNKPSVSNKNNNNNKNDNRRNYWTPLQALENQVDNMECNEKAPNDKPPKVVLPPIKVLVQDSDFIKNLLLQNGISDFLLKKISIGVKIISKSSDTYNKIKEQLKEKSCQFFTHDLKSERPFSVVLYGLENKTTDEVKNELNTLGFNCKEVKLVTKTYEQYKDTIYIVYFERGSVKLHDLKNKVKSLFRVIVRWDYQRKLKNKIVQCRNCQMYGHGERGCYVRPNCANCAGKHKTSDCSNTNIVRCANCNNSHIASDVTCPNRNMYIQIIEKYNRPRTPAHTSRYKSGIETNFEFSHSQFPPISSNEPIHTMDTTTKPKVWYSPNDVPTEAACSSNLFTENEITELTFELISKLKECKTKHEQFNVIAKLAIKYVYSNSK